MQSPTQVKKSVVSKTEINSTVKSWLEDLAEAGYTTERLYRAINEKAEKPSPVQEIKLSAEEKKLHKFIQTFLNKGVTLEGLETELQALKDKHIFRDIISDCPGVTRFAEHIGVDIGSCKITIGDSEGSGRLWLTYNFQLKLFTVSQDKELIRYCFERGGIHIYLPKSFRALKQALKDNGLAKAIPTAFHVWDADQGLINPEAVSIDKFVELIENGARYWFDEDAILEPMNESLVKVGRVFSILTDDGLHIVEITEENVEIINLYISSMSDIAPLTEENKYILVD